MDGRAAKACYARYHIGKDVQDLFVTEAHHMETRPVEPLGAQGIFGLLVIMDIAIHLYHQTMLQ